MITAQGLLRTSKAAKASCRVYDLSERMNRKFTIDAQLASANEKGDQAMTNHSEPAGPAPTENAGLNWNWLSDRVSDRNLNQFDNWIATELADLEMQHEKMITVNSRKRSVRCESSRSSNKSDSAC